MATQDFTRKLTAILTADVKGYSRLMGENEIETVRTITAYREVMSTLIQDHRGRVVDSPGDNVLSEFASIIDALQCAVEIQKDFKAKNAELPEERRMEFRIGINLGDVIQDGERIYGDGVNIAARVEGLAEGGGICITRNVYDQVKKKLTLGYEYIGEHAVKNITEPVRVYRVLLEPEDAGKVIGEKIAPPKQKRKLALAASVFVIVGVITVTSWNMYFRPLPIEVPPPEKLGTSLPDNPSIAVLPFTNMSDDPKQEYLSDGITEDIITDLSKIKNLLVIARNSTFVYKGKPVDIKLVGLELGVRYVLEGSLRKAGSRVRITAQLIDTSTGYHLWSDRYDGEGEMEDVFDLQDRITNKIVSELSIKLTRNEKQNIKRPETDNIEAYDAFMRGWAHFQIMTSEDYAKAVHYFRKAIKIDPNYNRAYAALSRTIFQGSAMYGTKWSINVGTRSSDDAILLSFELLELAKKKPNTLAFLHSAHVSAFKFRFNQAIYDAQKALEIEPNSASANLAMCMALIYFGRPDEVTVYLEKYKKLNPGNLANYYYYLGLARFQQRRLAEAETLIKRAIQFSKEGKLYHLLLSSISAHLGHQKQARIALKKFGQGDAFNWNLKTVQRFFLFYNNQQFLKR
ncbi:hypothetical protein HOB30_04185, partial [Candidatus Falkowbacteria bacterium]|nr:hypothetical protein [Candidatus Falkowbacteria bacterium]